MTQTSDAPRIDPLSVSAPAAGPAAIAGPIPAPSSTDDPAGLFRIDAAHPDDAAAIESLLDRAFGPGRQRKSSYRFRRGVAPVPGLGLVARAREDGRLVGTIRYWPVAIGPARTPALLLGPLGIDPERQGRGIGRGLIRESLTAARAAGHGRVVLVGDPAYYRRLGFRAAAPLGLTIAGEFAERIHALALREDAFHGVAGEVQPVSDDVTPNGEAMPDACADSGR